MDTTGAATQHVGHAPLRQTAAKSSRAVLAWVIGIGGSGLALSALYATTGLGLGCPLKTFTGWDCPLCGGTRMGAALLHGDIAAAWHFNAFALVGVVLGTLVAAALITERIVRRPGTLARVTSTATDRLPFTVNGRGLAYAFLAACLVWLFFRNLVLGPLP